MTCALQTSRCSAIPVVSKNIGNGLFFRCQFGILSGGTSRHRAQARKDERRHAGCYSSSKLKVAALGPQIVGLSGTERRRWVFGREELFERERGSDPDSQVWMRSGLRGMRDVKRGFLCS